jgi:hypothetical protein
LFPRPPTRFLLIGPVGEPVRSLSATNEAFLRFRWSVPSAEAWQQRSQARREIEVFL